MYISHRRNHGECANNFVYTSKILLTHVPRQVYAVAEIAPVERCGRRTALYALVLENNYSCCRKPFPFFVAPHPHADEEGGVVGYQRREMECLSTMLTEGDEWLKKLAKVMEETAEVPTPSAFEPADICRNEVMNDSSRVAVVFGCVALFRQRVVSSIEICALDGVQRRHCTCSQ